MDNQEAKYIHKIEIEGLFGRFNVNWELNEDVNILVGENGTGKSTILKGLERLDSVISNGLIKGLHVKMANDIYINTLKIFMNTTDNFIQLHQGRFSTYTNTQNVSAGGEQEQINLLPKMYYIQTFDNQLPKKDETNKNYIKTELDVQLDKSILNYIFYENRIIKNDSNRNKSLNQILKKSYYFIEIVNKLFKPTNKEIKLNTENDGSTDSVFKKILENKEEISCFDLSSGEKQLLVILLTVLCQDEKPSILLMDEPEISLHIEWQYELIKIIRELNPNCQLIIVTHSTSIFTKGWDSKLFFTTGKNAIIRPVTEKA